MTDKKKNILRHLLYIGLLIFGTYGTACTLWSLYRTAVYVYETETATVTITNYTTKQFSSAFEALSTGNFSKGGDFAYFPIITMEYRDIQLQHPDNTPCSIHDTIEVRRYPTDSKNGKLPNDIRPNKFSLLWGGDLLKLLFYVGVAALACWRLCAKRKCTPQNQTKNKKGKHGKKSSKTTPQKNKKATSPKRKSSSKKNNTTK